MATITKVRARGVVVPLDTATAFSNRVVLARHYGLVEVVGDDGAAGIGFCYVGSNGATVFAEAMRTLIAPRLIGRDAHSVEEIWRDLYQEILLQGRAGTVMRALSATDVALWDRNARAAGLPLYKFLGAARPGVVPAYASGGYYLDGKTPADLADEMAAYVGAGFAAVKMKVGRGSLREEEARIAAVRERIGGEVALMLDANNAWSDLPTALAYARMFECYEPYWLEEPFSPDDIDNHVRLGAAIGTPIATGEIEAGRWRFKDLVQRGAVAILQTDACVCGGISEFRRIAGTAASFGLTVAPHWFHDLHAHLVAAVPNASWVEYFADDKVLNFRRLVDRQLASEGGTLRLSDRPGLGFDFAAEAVEQYAVTPWLSAG